MKFSAIRIYIRLENNVEETKTNVKDRFKTARMLQVLNGSDFTVILLHPQCQKRVLSAGSAALGVKKCLLFLVSGPIQYSQTLIKTFLMKSGAPTFLLLPIWIQLSATAVLLLSGRKPAGSAILLLHRLFLSYSLAFSSVTFCILYC